MLVNRMLCSARVRLSWFVPNLFRNLGVEGESMRNCYLAVALACVLCFAGPAMADHVPTTLGQTTLTPGTTVNSATFAAAAAGQPAPFNAACGSDPFSNCSASWTFLYTLPAGDTITNATLSLGIVDIDSAAPGNQVGSFTLDGTDDLTVLLNAASNGLNGGAGAPNSQYDILMITLPSADLAGLSSGSATFALTLSGPGLGVLGTTPFNGADLAFSTLDITATEGSTPPPPTPEPATWALLLTGIAALATKALLSRPS